MAAWILSALLLVTLASAPDASAAELVPAERAADAVGSTVTIEGDVASARLENDALVLDLAPVEEKSFRAILVLSLISSLPRQPQRVYEGKRVRVTGLVQRFHGRPEMVLESPDSIEIVDLAGAPAAAEPTRTTVTPTTTVPGTTTPPPAEPAAVVPAPVAPSRVEAPSPPVAPPPAPVAAAPAAAPPVAAPPTPAAPSEPPPPAPVAAPQLLADKIRADACERARAKWDDAASRIRTASAALTRCLDGGSHRCRQEATALAPAVADLEWAEQNLADRCD